VPPKSAESDSPVSPTSAFIHVSRRAASVWLGAGRRSPVGPAESAVPAGPSRVSIARRSTSPSDAGRPVWAAILSGRISCSRAPAGTSTVGSSRSVSPAARTSARPAGSAPMTSALNVLPENPGAPDASGSGSAPATSRIEIGGPAGRPSSPSRRASTSTPTGSCPASATPGELAAGGCGASRIITGASSARPDIARRRPVVCRPALASSRLILAPSGKGGAPVIRKRWPPLSISRPWRVLDSTVAPIGWPPLRFCAGPAELSACGWWLPAGTIGTTRGGATGPVIGARSGSGRAPRCRALRGWSGGGPGTRSDGGSRPGRGCPAGGRRRGQASTRRTAWPSAHRPPTTLARSSPDPRPSWTSTLARPKSPSNSRTRRLRRASACARLIASQVLPTPPLPDAIARIRLMPTGPARPHAPPAANRHRAHSRVPDGEAGGARGRPG
jgi:hypothetical protein